MVPHKGQPNGRENSWGLAQIYLPAHQDVTREQALDPRFALQWMAKEFSKGNQHLWSCARSLGIKDTPAPKGGYNSKDSGGGTS